MLVCSEVTSLKVKILGKWIFFLPSGKRRRQESFIRKCWRQDELLRKRPKRRKYLILSIINKKLLTLTRIAFEISSILEEIKYCPERDKLCLMSALHCDWCTFAVHCWKAWFQRTCMSIEFSIVCRLENVESGKRKYCLNKGPGKASNFPPSKTLFEPCSSCGYYFCFSRVSVQESVRCNYCRDLE